MAQPNSNPNAPSISVIATHISIDSPLSWTYMVPVSLPILHIPYIYLTNYLHKILDEEMTKDVGH